MRNWQQMMWIRLNQYRTCGGNSWHVYTNIKNYINPYQFKHLHQHPFPANQMSNLNILDYNMPDSVHLSSTRTCCPNVLCLANGWLVVEPTPFEKSSSKWESSPIFRGEHNKQMFELPPPSWPLVTLEPFPSSSIQALQKVLGVLHRSLLKDAHNFHVPTLVAQEPSKRREG